MKRNLAIFTATFIILSFFIAACVAAVFISFGGTSLRECFDLTVGELVGRLEEAPTLGERLDEQTSERICSSADIFASLLPFRKRVAFKALLTGVFFLKTAA